MNSQELGLGRKLEGERCTTLWKAVAVTLVVVLFLFIGFYFIIVGIKIQKPEFESHHHIFSHLFHPFRHPVNESELEFMEYPQEIEREYEEYGERFGEPMFEEFPRVIPEYGYGDKSHQNLNENRTVIVEKVWYSGDNLTKETTIILKNNDTGKEIHLHSPFGVEFPRIHHGRYPYDMEYEEEEDEYEREADREAEREAEKRAHGETTTPGAHGYSPTIPRVEEHDTTKQYKAPAEVPGCLSPILKFCEGVLPYDMIQLPNLPGVHHQHDLLRIAPYYHTLIEADCSARAREFLCTVLQPECQADGQKKLPCRVSCLAVLDDCKHFIVHSTHLSRVFNCSQYPEWEENGNCMDTYKGKCNDNENKCSDGTCIPAKWECEKYEHCPGLITGTPVLERGAITEKFTTSINKHCRKEEKKSSTTTTTTTTTGEKKG